MELIKFKKEDLNSYLEMCYDFYHSPATDQSVPEQYWHETFNKIINNSELADGYMVYANNQLAGYLLLSFTWSNEAGGEVVWIEELYLKDDFRGKGLGKKILTEVLNKYGDSVKRFRLEVAKTNPRSKKLYSFFGFSEVPYEQMYKDIHK